MGMRLAGAGAGRFSLGQNAEINVTPFVDVMLVLLIIFMVSLPIMTKNHELEIPPAVPGAGEPPVVVSIERAGLFIGERPTSIDSLIADLAQLKGAPMSPDDRIYLRAGRDVRYEQFMAVINTLKGKGYKKLGVVSEAL